MRTALLLLLLLAVVAVPGSILPQRNIDASRVADYIDRHRSLGPWLDRLSLFDVYASPWFASVYLLLSASLVGCVIPRTRSHWQALRTGPPRPPRRPDRLPVHLGLDVQGDPTDVARTVRSVLRGRHYRLRAEDPRDPGGVSAERGLAKETGNLLFHAALIVVIAAIGARYLWGWRGDVIVPAGQTFASTASGYGTLSPGPFVDPERLPPFTVRVDSMNVTFEDRAGGAQFGAPRDFVAETTTTESPGAESIQQRLTVNNPLSLAGTSVFLLGNGYAPVVTVRDRQGRVLYREATPFLPQDNNYRSIGAVKVTAGTPKQFGFAGLFLPTATIDPRNGPTSVFPDVRAPALALTMYEGELFADGRPQSVYSLDTSNLTQVTRPDGQPLRLWLTPGKAVTLPEGRGTITLESVERFAGLSVRHDPGKGLALVGALGALGGLVLTLSVPRRRVFARIQLVSEDLGGTGHVRCRVVLAGLTKSDDSRLAEEVERVAAAVRHRASAPRPEMQERRKHHSGDTS